MSRFETKRASRWKNAMEDKRIKIVLVENHPIVRQGLKTYLEANANIAVVAEADDGVAAIFACEKNDHDIVVVNAVVPGSDTFQVIASLKKNNNSKIIVSSIEQDINILHDIRKCGADGFLGKDALASEYLAAISTVNVGGTYFSQDMADTIFQMSKATSERRNAYGLTGRELEILSMLSSGYCNKEVANKYELSVRTVEAHRLNIRRKTQSNTLSDLVRISRSLGLANLSGNMPSRHSENLSHGHVI